ncbi:oligopeptide ABC transporter substrate-binding protein OppA [Pectobacterium punjabense]|uniref:Oligopeptide ABC transporter substrate-binding protein OppA n=1 Tax=Pectobacterium punjabense TaxID=2108399 RepID=A0ABX6L2Z7_9GAMM|nr:ABC transporter substrate-binding protein [Pectobacterium punjabense]MBS4431782.1 oligopeptide ABC transporter substrate-binding protein OppA [Pectobacterium punjabense]PTA66045.1 oligopeptide ABC transporter substrate-binding protein OppA [Pectobacterium punjabense]QJA20659.1 oligopeptide ABC transporter substrate-binding protein OppA [Pectobacterium punjabense]
MNGVIKKRFKHSVLLLTLCATGAITSVFAAQVPAGVVLADKQELVRGNGSEPASLDPHKVESNVEGYIIGDFFDNLVHVGDSGTIQPRLAERWENKDNTVWTFHLRPDAKWSDGSPITADDVVFSWRRLSDPKTLSPYGSYVSSMYVKNAADIMAGKKAPESLGIKALDSHTVEITLEHPISYFLEMSSFYVMVPLPKAVIEKHPENWTQVANFVSSGPYTLNEWVVNERIVGKRNSQYWDDAHTVINKVTYLPISSQAAELNRYKSGEIDVTNILSPIQFASLKKDYPQEVKVSPLMSTYFYRFNMQKAPFNDPRVRRALDLSLDKNIIANNVLGMGQTPAYSLIPKNVGGFQRKEPEWAGWTQQQRNAEAKKLLKEAGFDEKKPLKFTLLYNTSESHLRIAIAATSMWKKNLGLEVTLQNQEWKTMLDTVRTGDFEVVRHSWTGDYNEASTFLNTMETNDSSNNGKYSNAEYDGLLKKALTVKDKQEKEAIYQQASDILDKDMALIPIYYYVQPQMAKTYIGGFAPDYRGDYYTKDMYVIKH